MKNRIRNILYETIAFKDRPNINDSFWKWFGDSKVIDSSGNPLIVYHGTDKDFSEFKKEFIGIAYTGSIYVSKGFYFTNSLRMLDSYVGTYMSDMTDKEFMNQWKYDKNHPENIRPNNVYPVYLRALNPFFVDYADIQKDINAVNDEFHSGNYDSCFISTKYHPTNIEYIVYDPTQIKSIFNQGTWNPNNADIMK
jgi:hypothetical protein